MAGPLGIGETLADRSVQLAPICIMRVKRLRRLLRTGEVCDSPEARATLATLTSTASTYYRRMRRDPAAWAHYAAQFEAAFYAGGERAALAVPMPDQPGFDASAIAEARAAATSWGRLCAVADRDPAPAVVDPTLTREEIRSARAAGAMFDRATMQARRHRDAITLAVIEAGRVPPGSEFTLPEVVHTMTPAERVAYDLVAMARMGRPAIRYEGHALAHLLPHQMV